MQAFVGLVGIHTHTGRIQDVNKDIRDEEFIFSTSLQSCDVVRVMFKREEMMCA